MAIAKKAANEKHFKKDQPVTSGQRLYDYVQTKQTANKPQKSGKEHAEACRKAGGPIYS